MDSQQPSPASTGTTEDNSDLRPELQPIAARHGRKMLDFAVRISACNVALDRLVELAKRSNVHGKELQPLVAMLLNAQGDLANACMEARGWNWDTLVECIGDIGRAGKLAAGAAAVQGPGTSTVQ